MTAINIITGRGKQDVDVNVDDNIKVIVHFR